MVLSHQDDISTDTLTTTEGEGDGTVGGNSEGRGEERNLLSMSAEWKPRRVRKENTLLPAAVNEYKMRVKNL